MIKITKITFNLQVARSDCPACDIVEDHDHDVKEMQKWAEDKIKRPGGDDEFRRNKKFYDVWNNHQKCSYTIEWAEKTFKQEFPLFESSFTQFPPGQIFIDNMAKNTRARDLEEKHKNKPFKDWPEIDQINYNNRIDCTGQYLISKAIAKEINTQTNPQHPAMNILGFKLEDAPNHAYYGKRHHPKPKLEPKHNIMTLIPHQKKLEVVFSQVKTIKKITEDDLKTLIKEALEQTRWSFHIFLTLMKDIGAEEVLNLHFRTMAIFPETEKPSSLCHECNQKIIFRSEIR